MGFQKGKKSICKKIGGKIAVVLAVIALLGVYYYVALPAVNIHATELLDLPCDSC